MPQKSCIYSTLSTAVLLGSLSACSGGGADGSTEPGRATLNLNLTDAPMDSAKEARVEFGGIELKPAGSEAIRIEYDAPRSLDLLALQDGVTASLLDGQQLEPGEYNWIRLLVNAERGVMDSYIVMLDDTQHSLFVPSGSQSGLQLNRGFTLAAGQITNFTIDFDLRKSVHQPGNGQADYFLRPSLRLVDNLEVGSISGTVEPTLIEDPACNNGDNNDEGNLVYLFAADQPLTDIFSGTDTEDAQGPIVTSVVNFDDSTDSWSFSLNFISAGDYQAAFTCRGIEDHPDEDNDDDIFSATVPVSVSANQDAEIAITN